MDLFLVLVIAAIIAMVAALAWMGQRRNTGQGDEDNPDYHILHSEYQSGVGGGESGLNKRRLARSHSIELEHVACDHVPSSTSRTLNRDLILVAEQFIGAFLPRTEDWKDLLQRAPALEPEASCFK